MLSEWLVLYWPEWILKLHLYIQVTFGPVLTLHCHPEHPRITSTGGEGKDGKKLGEEQQRVIYKSDCENADILHGKHLESTGMLAQASMLTCSQSQCYTKYMWESHWLWSIWSKLLDSVKCWPEDHHSYYSLPWEENECLNLFHHNLFNSLDKHLKDPFTFVHVELWFCIKTLLINLQLIKLPQTKCLWGVGRLWKKPNFK